MRTNNKNKEPQIQMGLQFSGSRLLEYLRFRLGRITTLLDQYTFWRSPLLWLILFLNVILSYLVLTQLLDMDLLPPSIPLFYYSSKTSALLFKTNQIPYLLTGYLALQAICIYVASRLYFRLKQLSQFTLLMCVISTGLFFLALYKSITLTLPLTP